jgi:hypothetical protein
VAWASVEMKAELSSFLNGISSLDDLIFFGHSILEAVDV